MTYDNILCEQVRRIGSHGTPEVVLVRSKGIGYLVRSLTTPAFGRQLRCEPKRVSAGDREAHITSKTCHLPPALFPKFSLRIGPRQTARDCFLLMQRESQPAASSRLHESSVRDTARQNLWHEGPRILLTEKDKSRSRISFVSLS